jgi:hypothetical protein
MRPRDKQEHAEWKKSEGEIPPMIRFMSAVWECAGRKKFALLDGNLNTFGDLMTRTISSWMR